MTTKSRLQPSGRDGSARSVPWARVTLSRAVDLGLPHAFRFDRLLHNARESHGMHNAPDQLPGRRQRPQPRKTRMPARSTASGCSALRIYDVPISSLRGERNSLEENAPSACSPLVGPHVFCLAGVDLHLGLVVLATGHAQFTIL